MLLVNLVLDVSAQTVPKDLGPFLWRGLRSVCTCLAPVYGSDGNYITINVPPTVVDCVGGILPSLSNRVLHERRSRHFRSLLVLDDESPSKRKKT